MQNGPSRSQPRPPHRPTFLWQGALIVLPALLLAGVGFFSLRQDRILAEHEATAQAKKIAQNFAEVLLPAALHVEAPSPETIERFRTAPTQPENDPISVVASRNGPVVACVINPAGELLYPPPISPLPLPQPVDPTELTDDQRNLWTAIQAAVFAPGDWATATNLVESFLATSPPESFAALAQYQVGVLSDKAAHSAEAQGYFEKLIREHPNAPSESGFLLRDFAELQLLQLAAREMQAEAQVSIDRGAVERLLSSLCSRTVVRPSALSSMLLTKAEQAEVAFNFNPRNSPLTHEWRQTWELHEAARGLFDEIQLAPRREPRRSVNRRSLPPHPGPLPWGEGTWTPADGSAERAAPNERLPTMPPLLEGEGRGEGEGSARTPMAMNRHREQQAAEATPSCFWLSFENGHEESGRRTSPENTDDFLLVAQRSDQTIWWFAWPETRVREAVQRVLQAQVLPGYFGLSVVLAERSVFGAHAASPLLAAAVGPATATLPLKVSVHLIDARALYARQRLRTIWFGSLIGLSTGAVLVGFLAAWRAFRRQQQLTEMKSNFVSSVSHEIRAPIASVRLMAEELEDIGPHDRQKSKDYHRFIVQECRRLSALIENVLDFSRIEQGRKQFQFEPTDIEALVRETTKLMQPYAAEREVRLNVKIGNSQYVPSGLAGAASLSQRERVGVSEEDGQGTVLPICPTLLPHPGPLPQGEGILPSATGEAKAARFDGAPRSGPPLPKGEGRGEGESGREQDTATGTEICLNLQPLLDGRAIQQVLVNLIDNAIKHSPKGKTVTVGLDFPPSHEPGKDGFHSVPDCTQRSEEQDQGRGGTRPCQFKAQGVSENSSHPPKSENEATPHPGPLLNRGGDGEIHPASRVTKAASRFTLHAPRLHLWVEDQGEGIPTEEHERIFERFYRRGSELRRETQGVGLGLAIVKYVVEAHGGRVTVRSAVGQGSRFTVELPINPDSKDRTSNIEL